MITNSLDDLKQTIFSRNKDPKDKFEMIAQVCEKNKVFENKTTKKILEKNFLMDI